MNRKLVVLLVATLASFGTAPAALACGEGMFNSGKGLPYQTYLAPRPAAVLVYDDPQRRVAPNDADALFAGLVKAGHTVTVVTDADSLQRALAATRYDVVLTAYTALDALPEAVHGNVVPVVARAERSSPRIRERFSAFVIDGASLGQYLRAIDRSLALHAK